MKSPKEPSENSPKADDTNGNKPRKVRYAVVGLGNIAQSAILPGFARAQKSELVALVSGDRNKLARLKREYRVPHTYDYSAFDRCLADPGVDAVYIALPNDLHLDYAVRAASARKHILCEKPLATNVRDARLIGRVADEYGVKIMTAYRLHFEPATLSTLELVRSGKLGDARFFNSAFSYQITDRENIRLSLERGGGPVYDIGIYCINAARCLMRDEPIEVSALLARSGGDHRFDEVEETAAIMLRFPRGRLATFVVSFGAAETSRLELVGTKGRVVLEPAFDYSRPLHQVVTIGQHAEQKTFPRTDQFGGEIEVFSECILANKNPEASADEGIADVRIIEAIFASAARGTAIKLAPWHPPAGPVISQIKSKPPAHHGAPFPFAPSRR